MKRLLTIVLGLAGTLALALQAQAFTSRQTSTPISVGSSGVAESTTLGPVTIVQQGTGDPGTPASLNFGSSGNTFRESTVANGASLRVPVTTNLAGVHRLILYTNNLSGGAVPQCTANTGLGNDCGGLVGVTTTTATVPLVWALGVTGIVDDPSNSNPDVFNGTSSNVNYSFTPATLPALGATNAVFFTDRAHVATFTTAASALDNVNLQACSGAATLPVAVNNTNGDGLYSQYFGEANEDQDLCISAGQGSVTLPGQALVDTNAGGYVPADHPALAAQELSKNIAVVAFNLFGTAMNIPRLDTTVNTGDIVQVVSPLFLPIAADFRVAGAQDYGTNTITLELVSQ